MAGIKHVILTGPPGVGKTTLVHKVCQTLQQHGIPVQGFYTEEKRDHGSRIGFDVVTLDGQRGQLARTGCSSEAGSRGYFVGQYHVQVEEFEQIALPVLMQKTGVVPVYVIDEIGKMELFSEKFCKAVTGILTLPASTVFATLPIKRQKPIHFVEEIRCRKDVRMFEISRENRNYILGDIIEAIETAYRSQNPN